MTMTDLGKIILIAGLGFLFASKVFAHSICEKIGLQVSGETAFSDGHSCPYKSGVHYRHTPPASRLHAACANPVRISSPAWREEVYVIPKWHRRQVWQRHFRHHHRWYRRLCR